MFLTFCSHQDLLVHPAYTENTGTVLFGGYGELVLPVLTADVCGLCTTSEGERFGCVLPLWPISVRL
jgi:hypothetical protein